MKKKWLIAVFLVIVIGVFIGINVWNEKSSGSTDQINTTALEEQEVKETVMASGELKFADEQNVYFQEDKGEVDEFLVEEGDDVEKIGRASCREREGGEGVERAVEIMMEHK